MPHALTTVPDELRVHINRDGARELDVPNSIEVTGSFDIRFINHGEALHVHLNASDALADVTTIDTGNRHVPGNGERRIHVDVDTDAIDGESVHGRLEVTTGYGAIQRFIDVEVKNPAVAETGVQVSESLAEPAPDRKTLVDRPELLVIGLGILALFLAAVVGLVIEETLVLMGVGVVAVGVLVALIFILK